MREAIVQIWQDATTRSDFPDTKDFTAYLQDERIFDADEIERINNGQDRKTRLQLFCRRLILKPEKYSNQILDVFHERKFGVAEYLWSKIEELGLYESEPDERAISGPFDGVREELKGSWRHKDSNFKGRSDFIDGLIGLFERNFSAIRDSAVYILISGMGGVGKTTLVAELAYKTQRRFIFTGWLRADSTQAFLLDFVELGKTLGVVSTEPKQVKGFLQRQHGWLLILDNVNNFAELRQSDALPKSVRREVLPGGFILMTSRLREKPFWMDEQMDLDVFPPQISEEFLKSQISPAEGDPVDAITKLADTLDHLPLTLAHAAAYIRMTDVSLEYYMQRFEEAPQKLFDPNKVDDFAESPAVLKTWQLSIEKVGERCPSAVRLIEVCAVLDPSGIPSYLLEELARLSQTESDVGDIVDAVALLRRFSLIKMERRHKFRVVFIHRMVQKAIVLDSGPEKLVGVSRLASDLLEGAFPEDSLAFGLIPDAVKPHADYLRFCYFNAAKFHDFFQTQISSLEPNFLGPTDAQDELYNFMRLAQSSNALGHHREAIKSWGKVLETLKSRDLGFTDIAANVMQNMALNYGKVGEWEEEKKLLNTALGILIHNNGKDHIETMPTMTNLAAVHGKLGDYETQEKVLEHVLEVQTAQPKPDRTEIVTTLTNLAVAQKEREKFEKAKENLTLAQEFTEKCYGKDHSKLMPILTALGNLLGETGKYWEMKAVMERALDIAKLYFGENHPEFARSLVNAANSYQLLEEHQQAEDAYKKALASMESSLNLFHDDVAVAYVCLANVECALGKFKEALVNFDKALKIRQKRFGPDEPATARVLVGLASVQGELENPEKQKELAERALEVFKEGSLDSATALFELASAATALKDSKRSRDLLEKVLLIQQNQLGVNHVETTNSLINLARNQKENGNTQKATELLEKCLKIREKFYKKECFAIGQTLTNLAAVLPKSDQQRKVYLQRALPIYQSHYGNEHIRTTNILNALAFCEIHDKNLELAKAYFLEELQFKLKTDRPQTDTAIVKQNLACCEGALGNGSECLKLMKEAFNCRNHHQESSDFACLMTNLARAQGLNGNIEVMRKGLEEVLELQQKIYHGSENEEVALTLYFLSLAMGALGFIEEKRAILEDVSRTFSQTLGENHEKTAIVRRSLEVLDGTEGDRAERHSWESVKGLIFEIV